MFRSPRHPMILRAAVCLSLALVGSVRAADNPAAWTPSDAVLYVGIPNCDQLVEAAKKTSGWRMLDDPQIKDVVRPWKDVATKIQALVARRLGLENPKDLEVYPHGGLAAFLLLTPPPAEGTEPGVHAAVVLEMGENAERMKRLTEVVVNECLENGAQKEVKDVAGGAITIIRFPKAEAPEGEVPEGEALEDTAPPPSPFIDEIIDVLRGSDVGLEEVALTTLADELRQIPAPEEFVFAFQGSKTVLASDEDVMTKVMKLLRDGPDESLASGPAMGLLKRHGEAAAPVHLVFNLPQLIQMGMKADVEGANLLRALGLDTFGPFVGTYELAPTEELDFRLRGFLEISNADKGLGKIYMMPNVSTAPPATIGAETAMFASINVQPAAILAEIIEITSRINPEAGEGMRAGLKSPRPDGTVLDVQNDVVNHLIGPLAATLTAKSPYGVDDINALISLGHKSRAAMDKLVALAPPGMLVPREMMGSAVYQPMMVPIPGLACGLTDRAIMPLGTTAAVEAHIRAEGRSGEGLAEESVFLRAARFVPDQSCVVMYVDSRKLFEAQLAIVKLGTVTETPPGFGASAGAYLQWWLGQSQQWKKLEHPEALRKFQSQMIATVSTTSGGLRFDAAVPSPAKEQ